MTATTLSTTRNISSRAAMGAALGAFLLGGALAAGAVVGLTDETASPEPVRSVEQGTASRSGSAVFDPDRGSITAIDQRTSAASAGAAEMDRYVQLQLDRAAEARSGSAVFDPDRGSITAIDHRLDAAAGAQYSAGAAENLWKAKDDR